MTDDIDIVDYWQIRPSGDGGVGVYDDHGMIAGPFGTREEALAAAMALPSGRSSLIGNRNAGPPSDGSGNTAPRGA